MVLRLFQETLTVAFLDKYKYLDIFHLHDDSEEQVDAPRTFDKSNSRY